MKKLLFITGTRADFGKIKGLIRAVDNDSNYIAYVYVSGMHLMKEFGNTYLDVLKENFQNIYVDYSQMNTNIASVDCGNVIINLTAYIKKIEPDMIIVHGDRIETLAGAIVGMMNNICVAHIEGGDVSGTMDDSIRHAVSKLAHVHFVSNDISKNRLIQLGEQKDRIFQIGSPDIDIMLSFDGRTIQSIKRKYNIQFDHYAIMIYHPVTTEVDMLERNIHIVTESLKQTKYNYIIIYPNNDLGYEYIINEYNKNQQYERFMFFKSLRFEEFLTLLKNAEFIIGNSSTGIIEAGGFGIPTIDIGTRQNSRLALLNMMNVQHVDENIDEICKAVEKIEQYRVKTLNYGDGNSADAFMSVLNSGEIDRIELQKQFVDMQGINNLMFSTKNERKCL